jgi:serine/threonine protein phosphatase PrpC
MAVADGAGSAQFSRQGSKIAVEYVIRNLPGRMVAGVDPQIDQILSLGAEGAEGSAHAIRTLLYEVLVGVAFEAAREVESEAKHAGLEASDFSTTLIMAALRKTPNGWFIATFSIGDGGAALLEIDAGRVNVMNTPDGGEFAGQTRFLRSSEFSDPTKSMERLHFAVRPNFTSLVLMTDGITDPKFPTEADMEDFSLWKKFWTEDLTPQVNLSRVNAAGVEDQLLAWLDFWSDGNHDDRTIALLLP